MLIAALGKVCAKSQNNRFIRLRLATIQTDGRADDDNWSSLWLQKN